MKSKLSLTLKNNSEENCEARGSTHNPEIGQTFKEIYASENNNEISENFNELKTAAMDTAKNLKELYDNRIREAIEKL